MPLGHLDQAIYAHARGDWAAANRQIRSFLAGLFSDVAHHIKPQLKGQSPSAENCCALLAGRGSVSKDRNQWTADGQNFLNGLFKMLHTDGFHPGLTDEDHSTFRLQLAPITGRALQSRPNTLT